MVFVTGGTGFLGSHLIYQLIEKGNRVRALKRASSNFDMIRRVLFYYSENAEELLQKIEWVEGDLLDIHSLNTFLKDVHYIYHCGAIVSFQKEDNARMQSINIEGTANLINVALKNNISKICHVSSIAAIGRAENENVIDEETIWKNSEVNSNYAVSKYGSEMEVWRGIEEGLNAIIVNPSVILGPGALKNGIGRMIRMVMNGFNFYTRGINGFVDVRDVASTMIALMENGVVNQRYIISADNIEYKQIFDWIAEYFNKPGPKHLAGPWKSEIAWRLFHIRKLITNKKPLITKETAQTANNKYLYSNKKILSTIDFEFLPIERSVKDSCRLFIQSE